jgi:L-ascorbate metabolism protein UlaG (beta-lactamase superfamily)
MKFTWIGGPTFLLQLGTFHILGDPVFSDTFELSPHGTVTRNHALPPVELPELDAVCVSAWRADHFQPGEPGRVGARVPLIAPPVVGGSHGFSDVRMLVHQASVELRRGEETLAIHATPAVDGNGYFLRHQAAGKETTVYWTGDQLWSEEVRAVQREHGHANLLVVHIGAETGAAGEAVSAGAKDGMQIVYRMQPNAVAAIHHHTFSHYAEPIQPFVDMIGRTIYEKRLRVLSEGESFEK